MQVSDNEPIFAIKGKSWKATGRLVENGFIVFKGSTVNHITESFKKEKSYYPVRVEIESTGIVVEGVFTKDHIFKSPAQAGSVIACCPVDTNKAWKTDDEAERAFGEVHPRMKGEKKDYSTPVAEKPKEEAPVEGFSTMPDGTPRFVEVRNGMVYEYRGREAEIRARRSKSRAA